MNTQIILEDDTYGDNFDEEITRVGILGVGGGGGNVINRIIERGHIKNVDLAVANTDLAVLRKNRAECKILLGKDETRGQGAGADPAIGKLAARETREEVIQWASNYDAIFIVAGMGGGTGTGGAPVIAEALKGRYPNLLIIGVVTTPFDFERRRRMRIAEEGVERLRGHVDTIMVIKNQNLMANTKIRVTEAFQKVDYVVENAIKGITDLITNTGEINVDFADIKRIMRGKGANAYISVGLYEESRDSTRAAGSTNRGNIAVDNAMNNALVKDVNLQDATGVLLSVVANESLTLDEASECAGRIEDKSDREVEVICGLTVDESMGNNVQVTIIATGFRVEGEDDGDDNTYTSHSRGAQQSASQKRHVPQNRRKSDRPIISRRTADPEVSLQTAAVPSQDKNDADGAMPLPPALFVLDGNKSDDGAPQAMSTPVADTTRQEEEVVQREPNPLDLGGAGQRAVDDLDNAPSYLRNSRNNRNNTAKRK